MTDLPTILEPISARGWPARVCDQLGEWRLHASSGYSGRANACWPIGDPGMSLPEAIAAVERWYGERGLPPVFRPADIPQTDALRAALAQAGYQPRTATLVMVGDLADADGDAARLSADPDAGFTQVFLASAQDPGDAAERIETLARIPTPRAFARIDLDGAPAAVGAVSIEGQWAGLFGMRTIAEQRRRGLARKIMAALSRAAIQAGGRRAYLQVEASNAPAVALYRGLGFETAYGYRYWVRGAGAG